MKRSLKIVSAVAMSAMAISIPATSMAQVTPQASVTTPGVNLRTGLDQLLGEHALLLEQRMQALYSGNTAQYNALSASMSQNTIALTNSIAGVYGKAAAKKFESLWNQHMYFFNYVNAVKGENSAQTSLTKYKNQFSVFMAKANPNFSESTLSSVLQEHINQITSAFNSYASGNYTSADASLTQAYNLMYTAGGYLANGIVTQYPSKFNNGSTTTSAVNVQVTLDQLLGEHAVLLEQAMQALYSGKTSLYNAYMAQMTSNTTALTNAISSIYGSAAGKAFESLWNQHQYFFTYVKDVKSGNTQGAQQAQAQLTNYKNQFSAFMAKANPQLSQSTLSTVLQEHINQITTSFQNYVQGNYPASEQELVAAYNLMYTAGGYLAHGIAAQFPSKFNNSQTGTEAGNLRVSLDQLLGEHALILELRMQALYSGNTKLYNAFSTVMSQNTSSLTSTIASIYGTSAGQEFQSLWNQHRYFFNYADSVLSANTAQATLTYYKNQFAKFMASANPHISQNTLSTVLQKHIQQITTAFNNYANGNFQGADKEMVAAYNLMYTAGDYLATGIETQYPSKFANTSPNTPAGGLVASLDQLLGLHAFLLELRMQAQYQGNTPASNALATVMNQNTAQLTSAIGNIYGSTAAQEFESLWNQHMYFFTYASDIKAGNTSGAQAAQATLTKYKNQFSQFLAKANPHFSESTLSTVLQEHIDQISTAFIDYTKGNFSAADPQTIQAYNLMYSAGRYLAQGIVAQFPSKFAADSSSKPTMMKRATSPVTGLPLGPIMAAGGLLALAGGYLLVNPRQQ